MVHAQSRRSYGSLRLHAELRVRRHRVGEKRGTPNLVQRNFTVDAPNKVWVGDITYVWTREGWLYLAVLLDSVSRVVRRHSGSGTTASHPRAR